MDATRFNSPLLRRLSQLLGMPSIEHLKREDLFSFSVTEDNNFSMTNVYYEGLLYRYIQEKKGMFTEIVEIFLTGGITVTITSIDEGKTVCLVGDRDKKLRSVAIFFGPYKRILCTQDGNLAQHSQM